MFCTNGILLRMLTQPQGLDRVTHLVMDEVHERDCFADFLLIVLKQVHPALPTCNNCSAEPGTRTATTPDSKGYAERRPGCGFRAAAALCTASCCTAAFGVDAPCVAWTHICLHVNMMKACSQVSGRWLTGSGSLTADVQQHPQTCHSSITGAP